MTPCSGRSGPDVGHSVTADTGQAESFDSDPSGAPSHRIVDAYSPRFTQPGRFTYHCRVHPDTMRGEVEVVALPSTTDRRRPSLARVRVRHLRFTVSGGLEPGSYRIRMTAYDAADNRSRMLLRRFRLA